MTHCMRHCRSGLSSPVKTSGRQQPIPHELSREANNLNGSMIPPNIDRLMEYTDSFNNLILKIDPEQMYKTKEVAALLHCSVRYVQLLVELGRLDALRVGRLIRIPGQELIRFIHKHKDWHSRQ